MSRGLAILLFLFIGMTTVFLLSCDGDQLTTQRALPAKLVRTSPLDGSTVPMNGVLTLTFDNQPQSVMINDIPAHVVGTVAIWNISRDQGPQIPQIQLPLGRDRQFQADLEGGYIPEAVRGELAEKAHVVLSEDLSVKRTCFGWVLYDEERRTSYTIELWQGKYYIDNRGLNASDYFGDKFYITWTNRDGSEGEGATISLSIVPPDCAPPLQLGSVDSLGGGRFLSGFTCTGPSITECAVKNGEWDVDSKLFNAQGIRFGFSESVTGSVEISTENGELLDWNAEWEINVVTIRPTVGNDLVGGMDYIITMRVKDAAGNEFDAEIAFTTKL